MNVPNGLLGPEAVRGVVPSLPQRLAADPRRVVVFDDDPTGTQTVSDVDVLLDATDERTAAFFEGDGGLAGCSARDRRNPGRRGPPRIGVIVVGLLDAEAAGRSVVVRSASTFAAVRCGLVGRVLEQVEVRAPGRLLVACGSYTAGSRAQLAGLTTAGLEIESLDRSSNVDDLVQTLAASLDTFGIAAVATPRDPLPRSDLAAGAELMLALATVAGRLSGKVDGVIAKGGITSAAVAVALGAQTAPVEGQVRPGVALWTLDRMVGGIPYAVVPGNVGDSESLVRVVAAIGKPLGNAPNRQAAR